MGKKLASGERVFGGVVLARAVTDNEDRIPQSDWEYGCNDGFNNNAAGAICRSLGFGHGTEIPVSKKMFGPEDEEREFGWTNVGCRHDDTYVTSDSCRATRYQDALERRGLEATCFNFDILA